MNQVKNYFHRGENVSTAVRMFPPRWKCFHRGGNYFHLSTAVVVVLVVVVDILCYFQHVVVVAVAVASSSCSSSLLI